MTDDDDDDGTITEADLKAARERWADPKHQPSAPELFAIPVYADGFRGDVAVPNRHPVRDSQGDNK